MPRFGRSLTLPGDANTPTRPTTTRAHVSPNADTPIPTRLSLGGDVVWRGNLESPGSDGASPYLATPTRRHAPRRPAHTFPPRRHADTFPLPPPCVLCFLLFKFAWFSSLKPRKPNWNKHREYTEPLCRQVNLADVGRIHFSRLPGLRRRRQRSEIPSC